MTRLFVRWLISAAALMVVAGVVPGFRVRGFGAALIAALVIGFVNATLGALLKILTLPLTILTLGLFLLVVNALMLEVAAWFVPGFAVAGFVPALWGALILSVIHLLVRRALRD